MLGRLDINPAGSSLVDELGTFGCPAIIVSTLCIEMAEDDTGSRFFTDPYSLADRAQVTDAFVGRPQVSIMGVIDSTIRSRNFCELYDLFSFCVIAGNVKETG